MFIPLTQSFSEQYGDPGAVDRIMAALKRCPEPLRLLGYELLDRDETGQPLVRHATYPKYGRRAAAMRVPDLPATRRQQLFAIFLPTSAHLIEPLWGLCLRRSYLSTYESGLFRAPYRPDFYRARLGALTLNLIDRLHRFPGDIHWICHHADRLGHSWHNPTGRLLAAAIDEGAEELLPILFQIGRGEHPEARFGPYLLEALLNCDRPDAWGFVEGLLLGSGRQEGAREAILRLAPTGHPTAFRRLVRLLNEEKMTRFNSVIRALNSWLKISLDVTDKRAAAAALTACERFLHDETLARQAVFAADLPVAHYALICLANRDVIAALRLAGQLLVDGDADQRLLAANFFALTQCEDGWRRLVPCLSDDDRHIQAVAFNSLSRVGTIPNIQLSQLTAPLRDLPTRAQKLAPRIWPSWRLELQPQAAGHIIFRQLEGEPATALIPYFRHFSPYDKAAVIKRLRDEPFTTQAAIRAELLTWLGDRSRVVRTAAAAALEGIPLTVAELAHLEGYLTRKAADLRRAVLQLILGQADELALDSASRLLNKGQALQRQSGLELLLNLFGAGREPARCQALAAAYQAQHEAPPGPEAALLAQIPAGAPTPRQEYTLEDGLGLIDNSLRTLPPLPRKLRFQPMTRGAANLLGALDEWVTANLDLEITFQSWRGEESCLLGSPPYHFFHKNYRRGLNLSRNLADFPLRDSWLPWWQAEQGRLLRNEGRDLLRAMHFCGLNGQMRIKNNAWSGLWPKPQIELAFQPQVYFLLHWAVALYQFNAAHLNFCLDGLELAFHKLMKLKGQPRLWLDHHGRGESSGWWDIYRLIRDQQPELCGPLHQRRLWYLLRWRDEPRLKTGPVENPSEMARIKRYFLGAEADRYSRMPRLRPGLSDLLPALIQNDASEHDLLDLFLGQDNRAYQQKEGTRRFFTHDHSQSQLFRAASKRQPAGRGDEDAFHPLVQAAMARVRERIVKVELGRGDLPTAASLRAKWLRYSGGAQTLVALLRALGRQRFGRGFTFDGESKQAVLSHLIRVTFPGEADSPTTFTSLVKAAQINETRLVETALFAPQWAHHIETALEWPGLRGAVLWFHAHTKDNGWQVEKEVRDSWAAEIGGLTPLTAGDLIDGAVDVGWFQSVYTQLGADRWRQVSEAARFAASGAGHRRAQLFADALLGQLDPVALIERVQKKRYQDGVRALGLLPLPAYAKARQAEVLARYLLLQGFQRGSRTFGSQRQASEKLAVRIALHNLAQNAGYADPIRLEWAMERQAIADLADGPVSETVAGVTVSLAIDDVGEPQVTISRELKNGTVKMLKTVPAKLKKQPALKALTGRKTAIRRQAARTRLSLESAMVRGDHFTGAELQSLCQHPLLRPMLTQLLFIRDEDGVIGFVEESGTSLLATAGTATALATADSLRLVHPVDLLEADWPRWQRHCFEAGRIQPFKQIFRELYIVTPVERAAGDLSRRYAGQEVSPGQAARLLGQRGWLIGGYEGASKTFHDEKITAHVAVMLGYGTAAAVGGETIETVCFTRRGENKRLPLTAVPPRLFSEAMRDLDLVVSVAHLSGVDPEATHSSIEFRANLVRETATLLALSNVMVKERHVLIEGQFNNYSVHLGSGIIHQRPGGYVCVVPVHSAQRGRIFLPFVDKDPKSAEIIAKVVMLAHDRKIKDPTILSQLQHH